MTMNDVTDIPEDADLSFYEEPIVFESKPQRRQTLHEPLSAKKASKRLFDLYSEMTVDLPVWNEKDDMSWENSSTESEQANTFTNLSTRPPFASDIPGYVCGLILT